MGNKKEQAIKNRVFDSLFLCFDKLLKQIFTQTMITEGSVV